MEIQDFSVMISRISQGMFLLYMKRYIHTLPWTENQQFHRKRNCRRHLFMSEVWGVREWKASQASVFRLHAALIDLSPSLLKCTINQYSNKSSFILEKCSFQPSGHGVLVVSMRPGEAVVSMWPWASSTQQLIRECQVMTAHTLHYNINATCEHKHGQEHFECTVDAFLQPRDPTLGHCDVYIAFLHPQ